MKYSICAAFSAVLLVSACSSVNGLVQDARTLENDALTMTVHAVGGAGNLVRNVATDAVDTTTNVVNQIPR